MLPKMVDMKKTATEMQKDSQPFALGSQSEYPYGLNICLCDDELEKLGLDTDCEVGDFLHLFALAKVTSVSVNDTGDGEKRRIELTLTHLGCEEEDEENEKESKMRPSRSLYS